MATKRACVDVMTALIDSGMLLQSARGPIPNVAELVAGERVNGSWWEALAQLPPCLTAY